MILNHIVFFGKATQQYFMVRMVLVYSALFRLHSVDENKQREGKKNGTKDA